MVLSASIVSGSQGWTGRFRSILTVYLYVAVNGKGGVAILAKPWRDEPTVTTGEAQVAYLGSSLTWVGVGISRIAANSLGLGQISLPKSKCPRYATSMVVPGCICLAVTRRTSHIGLD